MEKNIIAVSKDEIIVETPTVIQTRYSMPELKSRVEELEGRIQMETDGRKLIDSRISELENEKEEVLKKMEMFNNEFKEAINTFEEKAKVNIEKELKIQEDTQVI